MKPILTIVSLFFCLSLSSQNLSKATYGSSNDEQKYNSAELNEARSAKLKAETRKQENLSSLQVQTPGLLAAGIYRNSKPAPTADSISKEISQLERKIEQAQESPIPDADRLERLFAMLRVKLRALESFNN